MELKVADNEYVGTKSDVRVEKDEDEELNIDYSKYGKIKKKEFGGDL